MVFANQTLYTTPRLAAQNYFQEIQKYSLATNLGILCVFFWLIQMQTVIQLNIILLKRARPYNNTGPVFKNKLKIIEKSYYLENCANPILKM